MPGFLFLAVAVAVGVASGWSVSTITRPAAEEVSGDRGFATYILDTGTVESSMTLNAAANWDPAPVGTNRAAGVVTSVADNEPVSLSAGDIVYSIDLRPVVVAEGDIPAFRDISLGVQGPDVEQAQHLLADLEFFDETIDGVASEEFLAAVEQWQTDLGVKYDPAVGLSEADIIFVPTLDTPVLIDATVIQRGAMLNGGEPVLTGVTEAPHFGIAVSPMQAAQIPVGAEVQIEGPQGHSWSGVIVGEEVDDNGDLRKVLEGLDGLPVCGAECGSVSTAEGVLYTATIELVPATTGIVAPTAALTTDEAGTVALVTPEGDLLEVAVIVSAQGMAVIEGAEAGTHVRLPATR